MKYVAIINQGHKKDTPGKKYKNFTEWDFNMDLGRQLYQLFAINKKDIIVHFTLDGVVHPFTEMNGTGRTQNLDFRISNERGLVKYYEALYGKGKVQFIFLDLHANAFSNEAASGYEIYCYKMGGNGEKLARAIHKRAKTHLGVGTTLKDRGVKACGNNIRVVARTYSPAVCIEHAFYTNNGDRAKLKDPRFRTRCAEHIMLGVLDYWNLKADEPPVRVVEKEIPAKPVVKDIVDYNRIQGIVKSVVETDIAKAIEKEFDKVYK